jgi:hypothetical protein
MSFYLRIESLSARASESKWKLTNQLVNKEGVGTLIENSLFGVALLPK